MKQKNKVPDDYDEVDEEEKTEKEETPVRLNEQGFVKKTQQRMNKRFGKNLSEEDKKLAGPVFDEFLKAFIITRFDKSFYLDLNGVYDVEYKTI